MSNPYKDIASYGYKDSSKFKGREEDIKKFFSILNSEICSVLYAESGIGKTSFINAGVEPVMIQQGFFPIHIIFPEYVFKKGDSDFSIETWLVEYIKSYNENEEKSKILDKDLSWNKIPIEIENNIVKDRDKVKEALHKFRGNLWWLLHTYYLQVGGRVYRPYIVFDQFEEIFVKTAQEKSSGLLKDFFSLMEQVTSNSIPEIIRSGLDELADVGAYFRINCEAEYKITFSLRKEFLSDFDYWTNEEYSISELYRNRMMLRPLTKKQAEKVITKQPIEGEDNGKKYDETLIGISDEIINKIDDKSKDVIEPVLLSIICSRLYDKASTLHKKVLEKSDLQLIDISTEISDFYEGLVQNLIKEKVFKGNGDVERFERLFVSEVDGHRLRKSMRDDKDLQAFSDNRKIKRNKSIDVSNSNIFDHLEGVHLIRRSNVGDDTYIELIHDRFAEVIHQKQIKRYEKRLDKYWKYGCFVCLLALFLYTIFYTCGNPEGNGGYCSYYSEITNRLVDSCYNNSGFAEELCIKKNTNYNLYNWYHLKKIDVKSTNSVSLHVTSCPQLTDIYISEDVVNKAKLNVEKCKRVNIHIKSDVDTLLLYSDTLTTLTFDIKNGRYKQFLIYRRMADSEEIDNYDDTVSPPTAPIIWDSQDKKAVYVSPGINNKFRFPDELCLFDSLKYGGEWYYNIKSDTIIDCHEIPLFFKTNNCRDIRSIVLTDSVRRIQSFGFSNFNNLETIELSDNIDTIGAQAFLGLTKLESVIIPKSVKLIGAEAFCGCSNLKRVIFKTEKAITINKRAFSGCSSLEFVELPDSVVADDLPSIFGGCVNIKKVIIRNPQKSNLAIKDKVVCEKSSGIPLLLFTDFCTYSNKSSGYYSENGILYRDEENGRREMVFTPKHADFYALTKTSQFSKSGDWIIDWGNSIVYSHFQNKELRIPALNRKPLQKLTFWLTPDSLERIYSPYPQPDCKDSVLFRVWLPDSIKSRIVLYVPYGCKKYYKNHPAFISFKSIEEETIWRRPFNIIYAYVESTKLYFEQHKEIAYILCLFILVVGFVFYKVEKKVYANTQNDLSSKRIMLHTINKLGLYILIYTILYWFILILFKQESMLIVNCIAIPLSVITIYVMLGRQSFEKRWIIIKYLIRGINWRIVITVMSAFFAICVFSFQARNLFNLNKMLSNGKHNLATSLMCSQIMGRDSITTDDSILIRKVLLSSECLPLLLNNNELRNVRISRFTHDENCNMLMVGKKDSLILLDFNDNKQYGYKMPLSNSYYINDRYICGYSNGNYSYTCKRNASIADTLRGDYLHFADKGNFVAATTDTTCYIYDLHSKAKLTKKLSYEKGASVETSQTSNMLTIQERNAGPVKLYNLHNLNDVLEKRIEGNVRLITDSYIVSDNKIKGETCLYDQKLSLKFRIKGRYPLVFDNKEINFATKGKDKVYFHSILSNNNVKTDSLNFWLSNSHLSKYQKCWNWSVIDLIKKLSHRDMRYISIIDNGIILYEDSTKMTHVFTKSGKLMEILTVKGDAPNLIEPYSGLYTIKSLNEDSISVYRNEQLLLKYPYKYGSLDITESHLIDKSGSNVLLITSLKNPSVQNTLYDQQDRFSWNAFYIDGYVFKEYGGDLYFENYLSIDELIEKSKYLNKKQKKNLKQKWNINKRFSVNN